MNVDGTRHLLDIVEADADSTAPARQHRVCCGQPNRLALESEIHVGQTFKNAYEESKCRAELSDR